MKRLTTYPLPLIWLTHSANFSAVSGHSVQLRLEKRKAMSSESR